MHHVRNVSSWKIEAQAQSRQAVAANLSFVIVTKMTPGTRAGLRRASEMIQLHQKEIEGVI